MFCENASQTLGDEARELIFQVARGYLERHGITATQLVFDPAQHAALLDDGARFQEILQRIALQQGQHTRRPVSERMKELTALAEAAMARVKAVQQAGPAAPGSDPVVQAGVLLAQLLNRLPDWNARALQCLDLLRARTVAQGFGMLDQTLAEILRLKPAVADLFGGESDRARMIELCLILSGGGSDLDMSALPVVQRISREGGLSGLPRCQAALRERLLELLGGSLPLYAAEAYEEWPALLALKQRMRSRPELDADWQLATAMARRFARFANPEQLNPMLAREPEFARKVLLLLQLCREIDDETAKMELHGILGHYLEHKDFSARFLGAQATREDFDDLAATISGDLAGVGIPEPRRSHLQEVFRSQLAKVPRPAGSRAAQRGIAGPADCVTVGGIRVPLRNWSPAALQFGPCPPGMAVGDRLAVTVSIRNASLSIDFGAEAEILRVTDGLAAARYRCQDSGDEAQVRAFFAG